MTSPHRRPSLRNTSQGQQLSQQTGLNYKAYECDGGKCDMQEELENTKHEGKARPSLNPRPCKLSALAWNAVLATGGDWDTLPSA